MNAMPRRFEPVLKILNDAGVRYLIVGGVAVVLHGFLRTTGDLDLKRSAGRAQGLEDVAALEILSRRDGDV